MATNKTVHYPHYLLNLMIENIIRSFNNRPIGVTVKGEKLDMLAYADDIAAV